jgi:transposase InsO family protein
LTPIPVGGPFHRVGVDVLQLPLTRNGNRYVVCFVDYLTKWVEAFPVSDQRAETIANLFIEHVVCRHGVPEQLLSDRGANFLSDLLQGVCAILGVDKINTSGYHPQTDGLVEKFNSTLINMIAKCCEVQQHDWDEQLPYLLFAYRSSIQESTRESPFCLLYGRDPRLPTETVLSKPVSPYQVDLRGLSLRAGD